MAFHRVAGQFFNRPLLLTPTAADTISNFILARIRVGAPMAGGFGGGEHTAQESTIHFPAQAGGDGTLTVHTPQASRFYGEVPLSEDGSRRPLPFRRTAEGVAIITLVGEWVNRGGWIGASSGLISYEGFKVQMLAAAADPRTKSILLDLESPGGEAVGAFEAAAVVRRVAAEKPVTALVNGMAASAAYAIASAASRIVSIPTGISGSIGVVLMHLDLSEYLKKEGIKPTFIHAGARKVDANPYQALPADVRSRLQGEIDDFYALFVQTVAAGRPGLTEKAIRATEADTFMGADALETGLVDSLGSFEEVLADASRPGSTLLTTTRAPGASTTRKTTMDEDERRIRADERSRLQAILGSPEAKGRERQAQTLALTTDLSPAVCEEILRSSARTNSLDLDARMAGRQPLDLDPDEPQGASAAHANSINWDEITAQTNAELGVKRPGR